MPISKNGKPYFSDEQYQQARYGSNALEYARSRGYPLTGRGNYYSMEGHDSMIFTADGRWFWNSRSVSGGTLEFMMFYEQMSLPEAVLTLTEGPDWRLQAEAAQRQQQAQRPQQVQHGQPAAWQPRQTPGDQPQPAIQQSVQTWPQQQTPTAQPQQAVLPVQQPASAQQTVIVQQAQRVLPIPAQASVSQPQQMAPWSQHGQQATQPTQIKPPQPFELPLRSTSFKRLFGYLCNGRGISADVVKKMVRDGLLYESVKHLPSGNQVHNACFVSYDPKGNAVAAFQRSLGDQGKIYKLDVPGSNKSYGWCMEGNMAGGVHVFEAAIDAASYATFCQASNTPYGDLLALGGLADMPLKNYLNAHPEVKTVILCLDMDEAGRTATSKLTQDLQRKGYHVMDFSVGNLTHGKDWNEELRYQQCGLEQQKAAPQQTQVQPQNQPQMEM